MKLRLQESQMNRGNWPHFPTSQTLSDMVAIPLPTKVYAEKLNTLTKWNFEICSILLHINLQLTFYSAAQHLQLERCSWVLKTQYR